MSQVEGGSTGGDNSQVITTIHLQVEVEFDSDLWTDPRLVAEDLEHRLLISNDDYAPEALLVRTAVCIQTESTTS